MEILFIIFFIAFSSLGYSVALDQQLGFNPYPFGTTISCIMFHPVILVSSIYYLGWVWGILCFLIHLLGIPYATVGWIFSIPTLLISKQEQLSYIISLKLRLLFPCLIIGIIFTVISFFFEDFRALLDVFKENLTFTTLFIVIVMVLSALRIVVSKLSSNMGSE